MGVGCGAGQEHTRIGSRNRNAAQSGGILVWFRSLFIFLNELFMLRYS